MLEHVLIFGNGYDIPGRIRARGAMLGRPIMTSVLCWPDHLEKLEDASGHARVFAIRPDAPLTDWIAFARAIHSTEPVSYIGTFSDQCQDMAAEVGRSLGISTYTPEVIQRVFDKFAMRQRLVEAGVENTPAVEVTDPVELRAFAAEHGLPCIVKPRRGTASSGVSVVHSAEDVETALDRACGTNESTEVVAEKFLTGAQYSVEAFSEDGEHVIATITRKYSDPVSLVELGHVMPAPLDDAFEAEIRTYVSAALDALEVTFGPTHTEVVLTKNGPRIIESHLRVGGGEIWNMVTDATGVDLAEYQLRQCIGEKVLQEVRSVLADSGRAQRCEAIWFAATHSTGTLVDVTGTQGPYPDGAFVEVLEKTGAQLSGLRCGGSRLAQARAHADTPDKALELAQEAMGRLGFLVQVTTESRELL